MQSQQLKVRTIEAAQVVDEQPPPLQVHLGRYHKSIGLFRRRTTLIEKVSKLLLLSTRDPRKPYRAAMLPWKSGLTKD